MAAKFRADALIQQIDHLITKYETTDPSLCRELHSIKTELQGHLERKKMIDFAKTALRISVWVKFLSDHWPGS